MLMDRSQGWRIRQVSGGGGSRDVAQRGGDGAERGAFVGPSAEQWRRECGSIEAKRCGGSKPRLKPSDEAAIRVDGVVPEARLALEGAMTGAVFRQYVQQMLAPALNRDDIVVTDNQAAHKVKGGAETTEAVGASVWLLAALLAGPEPDRTDMVEGQTSDPQGQSNRLRASRDETLRVDRRLRRRRLRYERLKDAPGRGIVLSRKERGTASHRRSRADPEARQRTRSQSSWPSCHTLTCSARSRPRVRCSS